MDMFGNTKEKEKKKNRKRNRKCYYEDLTPSWQGSINALLASFVPSFFCFLLCWRKYFFCVGEGNLLWHNGLIILYI